jgi:hypothetical protein
LEGEFACSCVYIYTKEDTKSNIHDLCLYEVVWFPIMMSTVNVPTV